jgi:hypothetical protein
MRCNPCTAILQWLAGGWLPIPGPPELEEETMDPAPPQPTFRRCNNIKSRTNPDVQCPLSATHGDYCMRHHKNPRRFPALATRVPPTRSSTRAEHAAARRIQAAWRFRSPLLRFRAQGPAVNCLELATNQTELYSLDPLLSIPKLYVFSFADARRAIWVFDIRTLCHGVATGTPQENPYTREAFLPHTSERLHTRLEWLRRRKYQIRHVSTDTLTQVQQWNQRVLDIFLKIEALGYYVSCDWFHELSVEQHIVLYNRLFSLWISRLGLTAQEKNTIVPGHESGPLPGRLFKFPPERAPHKERVWWQKHNLSLIETFVTRAENKEHRKLGALYCLMGLVQVSRPAARALPWVVETVYA